jgi:hypothetical protein
MDQVSRILCNPEFSRSTQDGVREIFDAVWAILDPRLRQLPELERDRARMKLAYCIVLLSVQRRYSTRQVRDVSEALIDLMFDTSLLLNSERVIDFPRRKRKPR